MSFDSLHAISSRIWEEIQGGWIYDDERINLHLIRDKIHVARAKVIGDLLKNKLYIDSSFYQECCLEIECRSVCGSPHKENVVEIPQLISSVGRKNIKYLGTVDRKIPFEPKDVFNDFSSTLPFTGAPSPYYTRVDKYAVLGNLPTGTTKHLILIALLSNPLACKECDVDGPYPVPGGDILALIERQVMLELSGFLIQRKIDKQHNANPDS